MVFSISVSQTLHGTYLHFFKIFVVAFGDSDAGKARFYLGWGHQISLSSSPSTFPQSPSTKWFFFVFGGVLGGSKQLLLFIQTLHLLWHPVLLFPKLGNTIQEGN